MHPCVSRLAPGRAGRRGVVLALMLATNLPPLRAGESGADSVPPALPDHQHVLNGCFLSALAYVARFHAAFPAEDAQPLAVELKRFHGVHTIAVLTWRGWWWGRDEFFGVFPLARRVDKYPDPSRLVGRAQDALDTHAEREVSAGRGQWASRPPRALSTEERAGFVAQAAALLPGASEIFWVSDGREEMPVLFFRPLPGLVCLYEPLTGTAQAGTTARHAPSIVKAIAAQLGCRVANVRAAAALPATGMRGAAP